MTFINTKFEFRRARKINIGEPGAYHKQPNSDGNGGGENVTLK